MRILLKIEIPNETFNAFVRDGSVGERIQKILEDLTPEAVYFTEFGGRRTIIAVVDIADGSEIPRLAEPFFLTFNANVEIHAAMSSEELEKAGLVELGKKWG